MSFRRLRIELREFAEVITAHWRKLRRTSRYFEEQRLHDLCTNFDHEALCSRPLRHTRVIALDTETTGFEAYAGDEIIEIACVEFLDFERTGRELCSRVRPTIPIPPESTEIHGIRDVDVMRSPTIDELLPEIVDFLHDAVVVGHHTAFDVRFINRAMQRVLDCRLPNPIVDTMTLYLAWTGQYDRYGLDEVASACDVMIHDRHSARGDAIACGEIFLRIVRELLPPEATVGDLLAISGPEPEYGPEFVEREDVTTRPRND